MLKISSILFIFFLFSTFVFAKILVYGKLTSTDGKPMLEANVFLSSPGENNIIKSAAVQKDGKYEIEIDSEGLWILHFTGLFHHQYPVAIYSYKPEKIKLNVKLEAYHYGNNFDNVKVIGNFNNWSIPRAIKMKKNKDSTYSVVINTTLDTVFYRLVDVRSGGELECPSASGFISNGIKGYNSYQVVRNGKASIVFDPSKIIYYRRLSSFSFASVNSVENRLAQAYASLIDTKEKYESSFYLDVADRHFLGFKFNFAPYISKVYNTLNDERNPLVRQVLLLSFFELNYMSTHGNFVKVTTARQTLKDITPNSIVWSLYPQAISEALRYAAFTELQRRKYIQSILKTNPMPQTKATLLWGEIERKFHSLDYAEIPRYLTILLDQYGDSPEAIKDSIYLNYLHIKKGIEAPVFTVESSSDTNRSFNNNSFKGKFYLLYFWSTSSNNAVEDLDNINKAYRRYKNKNFEILSLSIDSSGQNFSKSKLENLGVKWQNINLEDGLKSKICKDFEVYSVPKAILINPEDKILAEGWSLRGNKLNETLKKYLNN
jgi:peroxiredoxin